MPDDDKYGTIRDDSRDGGSDPLGLIGWVLANKYKVTDYIGEGGFGEVYKGYNTSLREQNVVIKILKRDHQAEWSQKEARILGMLDHPNICRLVDFLPKDRALVVQYIDGKNLDEILKLGTPLTDKLFLRVANIVMDALGFAHKRKVAHRDIKPSNIMLDRHGHIYIIDFGIAKKIGGTVTKTGLGAGWSFWTAAPERRQGRKGYNPFLSDIYEIGVTLYYLATRQWPYSDPENPDPHRWGQSVDRPLSNRLRRILRKATHPSPDMRFQTIDEMAQQMARVRTIRKRSRAKYLVATLALVVAIAAGFYYRDQVADYWPVIRDKAAQFVDSLIPDSGVDSSESQQETDGEGLSQRSADSGLAMQTAPEAEQEAVPRQPVVDLETKEPPQKVENVLVAGQREELIDDHREPPVNPTLTVETVPADNAVLQIDGREVTAGAKMPLETGQYTVSVMHPDFPVLQAVVDLTVDTTVTYNLIDNAKERRTTYLSISTVPRIIDKDLRVWFNGRRRDIVGGRARSIEKKAGKWVMTFQIVEKNGDPGTISVDSFRVDTGPGGTIRTYQTSEALVDLSGPILDGTTRCKLVVFRSKE